MNFKVFPGTITKTGDKVPLIKDWQKLASNDPIQIKQWQETFHSNLHFWGIPTGPDNDLLVLDIDIKPNQVSGWDTIKERNLIIPNTVHQRTINGGTHFFFKYPKDGKKHSNKVKFMPGLDQRGVGGYIFFYGYETDWSIPISEAPDWMLNYTSKAETVDTPKTSNMVIAPDIAIGILTTAIEAVRLAPVGESNNILNTQSYLVGQIVASGAISREYAEQELFKAAKDRGKPDYEAKATIKSGLDGGIKNPLTCPFDQPKPIIDIPAIPIPERWTPKPLTKADLFNFSKLRKPQLFKDWSTQDIQITTADGGTGKSTLKLYEALCLALGDRFLGFECKSPGKTLFITGEDTAEKLAAMLGAIIRQIGIENDEQKLNTILTSIVIKKDADLTLITKDRLGFLTVNQDALNKVMQAVDDIKPRMIVFDPIASFWGSEAALNDMNKAVAKFMSELVERSQACVEMINHMGKQSSANKDMTQFAGRGGTGLPSHSRVSRVLRVLNDEEFKEMTGEDLPPDQSAMLCNVNKFSDGSPLLNKPFIILRQGYLFTRKDLSPAKEREVNQKSSDISRVFEFIRQAQDESKTVTRKITVAWFKSHTEPLSKDRVEYAISMLIFQGYEGAKLIETVNPDETQKDKILLVE